MLGEKTIEILKRQREEEFAFKGVDKEELTNLLIDNIGDVDGEVRDGLIYPCLAHLLYDKHFDKEKLSFYLEKLLDHEHLFYEIELNPTNSVLTRSFSSLQIVILLYVHKRDNILTKEFVEYSLDTYLDYFEKETHYEGYNDTVGWLHSVAHAADVFNQFFGLEEVQEEEMKRIFEAILIKLKQRDFYFQFDEDERMTVGLLKAIKRNVLSNEYLYDWFERFSTYEKNGNYPEMYYITKNVRNLLRALYFALIDEEEYKPLRDKIKEVLKTNVTLR